MLSALTVNRQFMREFIAADIPCFAFGMVEERGRQCGFLALRPEEEIPSEVSDVGFNFGHSLFGSAEFEVIHFAFEFYGFQTYNVLINPNNPLLQAVLNRMIADEDYFFFALAATGRVTAFRAEIGQETLSQVKGNLARIEQQPLTRRTRVSMVDSLSSSRFVYKYLKQGNKVLLFARETFERLEKPVKKR